MSCSNCEKTGSGVYAGNNSCTPAKAARLAENMGLGNPEYSQGVAHGKQSVSVNVEQMIPIIPALAAASQALTAQKIAQAEAGKVIEPPKTVAGKVLGAFTGRNKAAAISQANLDPAVQKNLGSQGIPVSGSVSFNQDQNQLLKVLGLLGGVVVAVVYFSKSKTKRRRR